MYAARVQSPCRQVSLEGSNKMKCCAALWCLSTLRHERAVQDMTENFSVESEMAKTVREIRARDPAFDMIKFLRALKQDVKPVIQARPSIRWHRSRPAKDFAID